MHTFNKFPPCHVISFYFTLVMRGAIVVLFLLVGISCVFAAVRKENQDPLYKDGERQKVRDPRNHGPLENADVHRVVKEMIIANPIVVFSKSYCPYVV